MVGQTFPSGAIAGRERDERAVEHVADVLDVGADNLRRCADRRLVVDRPVFDPAERSHRRATPGARSAPRRWTFVVDAVRTLLAVAGSIVLLAVLQELIGIPRVLWR